jgi:ribosomal protein S18 acetylase RimI-like enzyme
VPAIHVRRIAAGDAAVLREVRLRALADAPLAFGSTHARELAYPPQRWEKWARDAAAAARQVVFFAVGEPDGAPVGLASGVIDAEEPRVAHLFSMWVAAQARRSGAGAALVEATAAWAKQRGAATLRTAVTLGNARAARLYERAGFRDTGVREPLGHSDAEVAVLERAL